MTDRRTNSTIGLTKEYTLSGAAGGASGGNIFFGRGQLDTNHLDPAHNWGLPTVFGPPMPAIGPPDGARYENINTGDVWTFSSTTATDGTKTWSATKIPGRATAIEYAVKLTGYAHDLNVYEFGHSA